MAQSLWGAKGACRGSCRRAGLLLFPHSLTSTARQNTDPLMTYPGLIPLPLEFTGFYRSAEIPFSLLFLGIQTTSPDLPSRSINTLGNSTTPKSLSFLYMFHPCNRFPFPPPKEGCDQFHDFKRPFQICLKAVCLL